MPSLGAEQAVEAANRRFPFERYVDPPVQIHIARTVARHVPAGGRILDFGCGPCDKAAALSLMGYQVCALDDLDDYWHKLPGNREKILEYAKQCGIEFTVADPDHPRLPYDPETFDMVTAHDVIEHLHDSPRELLNDIVERLKTNGLLFITVPNSVNVRKRVSVLMGRTNLPPYDQFYWYPGRWRGHVREYSKGDCDCLVRNLGLEVVEFRSCHHMMGRVPRLARGLYLAATRLFPGWRDTWLIVARKPPGWTPRRQVPAELREQVLSGFHASRT